MALKLRTGGSAGPGILTNNTLIDEYLRHYTNAGKKNLASPEKDSEVVVMIPPP